MAIDLQRLEKEFNAILEDENFYIEFEQWLEARNSIKTPVVRSLGRAYSIGQLRKLIEPYSNGMSFGFRNQPMQTLYEVEYTNVTFVCFQ
jgi:hypothetical protein